jgi:hypothetical protein
MMTMDLVASLMLKKLTPAVAGPVPAPPERPCPVPAPSPAEPMRLAIWSLTIWEGLRGSICWTLTSGVGGMAMGEGEEPVILGL